MKKLYVITLLTLISLQQLYAQNGKFDIQLTLYDVDCANMKVYVDIEVKANSSATTFRLADQNYRMSFPREAVANPFIEAELEVSNLVNHPDQTYSLYSTHTLTGSLDTIVSYNMELSGGSGFPLDENTWVKVGRLGFDILSSTVPFELILHPEGAIYFPNTFIGELNNGSFFSVEEGIYHNLSPVDLSDICAMAPLAYDDTYTTDEEVPVTIKLLENDTDPNGNLAPASFNLLSTPPATQVSLNPTSNPGEYICTPASGFSGVVSPFTYEVCDTYSQCATATVYITVNGTTGITQADDRYTINLYPTAAIDEIAVEYLNVEAAQNTSIIITDVNGRILQQHQKNISGTPIHRFDVQQLTPGVYFLTTMIDEEWVARKFVKL